MAERSVSVKVGIVMPMATALGMWRRAELWDVEAGGRFDARSAVVQVWSHNWEADRAASELIGSIWLHWHTPRQGEATIYRLEWWPDDGGSEGELRRALALLSGGAVP